MLDVYFLWQGLLEPDNVQQTTVARSSRISRVARTAGVLRFARLFRVFRLFRLIRVVKLFRIFGDKERQQMADDSNRKPSKVGLKMVDLVSKRIILLV